MTRSLRDVADKVTHPREFRCTYFSKTTDDVNAYLDDNANSMDDVFNCGNADGNWQMRFDCNKKTASFVLFMLLCLYLSLSFRTSAS